MSWWDTKNFTKIASSAIKSAQKKIDTVLEISETSAGSSHASYAGDDGYDPLLSGNDFGWGGFTHSPTPKTAPAHDTGPTTGVVSSPSSSDLSPDEKAAEEEEEESWSSWGLKSFSSISGASSYGKGAKSKRKGIGKRLRVEKTQNVDTEKASEQQVSERHHAVTDGTSANVVSEEKCEESSTTSHDGCQTENDALSQTEAETRKETAVLMSDNEACDGAPRDCSHDTRSYDAPDDTDIVSEKSVNLRTALPTVSDTTVVDAPTVSTDTPPTVEPQRDAHIEVAHEEVAHEEVAHVEVAHDEVAHVEVAHDEVAHVEVAHVDVPVSILSSQMENCDDDQDNEVINISKLSDTISDQRKNNVDSANVESYSVSAGTESETCGDGLDSGQTNNDASSDHNSTSELIPLETNISMITVVDQMDIMRPEIQDGAEYGWHQSGWESSLPSILDIDEEPDIIHEAINKNVHTSSPTESVDESDACDTTLYNRDIGDVTASLGDVTSIEEETFSDTLQTDGTTMIGENMDSVVDHMIQTKVDHVIQNIAEAEITEVDATLINDDEPDGDVDDAVFYSDDLSSVKSSTALQIDHSESETETMIASSSDSVGSVVTIQIGEKPQLENGMFDSETNFDKDSEIMLNDQDSGQTDVTVNVYDPLSVVVGGTSLMTDLPSPGQTGAISRGTDSSIVGMWDDADLHHVQTDLVEFERSSDDGDVTSSTDVTVVANMMEDYEASSSSVDTMNQSRETGGETDASTETLKDADEDESQSKEQETAVNMDVSTSSVSSSSFVKCMLEEAMTESTKDDSSERYSVGSDRSNSDLVKIDSGHTSGDEIETTTSSDIEVISTPNGEGRLERPFDLSPLRHVFTSVRHVTSQTHRRTDSNSSSSGQSKHSDQDQLSPGREQDQHGTQHGRDPRPLRTVPRSKSQGHDEEVQAKQTRENEALMKKLGETAEILEAREKKLLELSRENVDLRENNSILRTQLHQSEEALENEMTDLNAITQEFTGRIRESEKKLQQANKERDSIKKQLQEARDALAKSHDGLKLKTLVEEKDEQIGELLAEGEKLSKQQLLSNNTIKKLRAREKELDGVNKTQAKKMEEQKSEVDRLTRVLNNLESMEGKQADVINSLNTAVKSLEKEASQLRMDNEDNRDKLRSMQAALDASYKEIHELNKANASKESEMQELVSKARRDAQEEMQKSKEMITSQTRDSETTLLQQIDGLQYNMSRLEKEHHMMEDVLRQELADLQNRLHEADNRNQDTNQSVTSATRPLLRQIENLQSNYALQASAWEKLEKSLSDQLADALQQCTLRHDKDKLNQDRLSELQGRVSSLESSLSLLRQEKFRLQADLQTEKARANLLEESKLRDAVQLDLLRNAFNQEINELKKEKVLLESQLDTETSKYENERRKFTLANEQLLREKEMSPMTPTPRSSSRSSDVSLPILPPLTQQEVLEHTLMMTSQNGGKVSLYESLRQNGAANLLDNLQSQLKQREGELMLLQGEIAELEETREAMANELVSLTSQNDELLEKVNELSQVQVQYNDLSSRYNALLQMYGEKVEEMQELRLDLQDVKDMYKTQIEELLKSR